MFCVACGCVSSRVRAWGRFLSSRMPSFLSFSSSSAYSSAACRSPAGGEAGLLTASECASPGPQNGGCCWFSCLAMLRQTRHHCGRLLALRRSQSGSTQTSTGKQQDCKVTMSKSNPDTRGEATKGKGKPGRPQGSANKATNRNHGISHNGTRHNRRNAAQPAPPNLEPRGFPPPAN